MRCLLDALNLVSYPRNPKYPSHPGVDTTQFTSCKLHCNLVSEMNMLEAIEEDLQRLDLSCFQLEEKRMFRSLNCCSTNEDFSGFEQEKDNLSRTIENKLDQLSSSIGSSESSGLGQNGKLLERLQNQKLKLRLQVGQMHERMGVAKEWSNPYKFQENVKFQETHYRERER